MEKLSTSDIKDPGSNPANLYLSLILGKLIAIDCLPLNCGSGANEA